MLTEKHSVNVFTHREANRIQKKSAIVIKRQIYPNDIVWHHSTAKNFKQRF